MSQSQLDQIAEEVALCRRCTLYQNATHAVFGEGPADAAIMLVGEQPGDQEDRAGRPFVGPAGRVLDRALKAAGLDRQAVYVTNAVKHFKHELRGKRRMHKQPNRGDVQVCRWWLDRELSLVEPKLVVALGLTAARELLGRTLVLSRERGRLLQFPDGRRGLVTIHPSAILRVPDETDRDERLAGFIGDLKQASALAREDLLS
jgi:uracil-DNA glycosylase family protein